jgi:hypothetical protein
MPASRFKIGQPVIYHGKRKAMVGRYVVLTVIPQRLGRATGLGTMTTRPLSSRSTSGNSHEYLTGVLGQRKGHWVFTFRLNQPRQSQDGVAMAGAHLARICARLVSSVSARLRRLTLGLSALGSLSRLRGSACASLLLSMALQFQPGSSIHRSAPCDGRHRLGTRRSTAVRQAGSCCRGSLAVGHLNVASISPTLSR